MPLTIQELILRLPTEPFCSLHLRSEPLQLTPGLQLPGDVVAFYTVFAGGDLFTVRGNDGLMRYEPDLPVNGWELDPEPFRQNANDLVDAPHLRSSMIPYHDRCYVLGRGSAEVSNHLCIDLNPGQFGWIFVNLGRGYIDLIGTETRVVAKSWTEWLERTLDFGPRFDPEDQGLEENTYPDVADDGYPSCVVPPEYVERWRHSKEA